MKLSKRGAVPMVWQLLAAVPVLALVVVAFVHSRVRGDPPRPAGPHDVVEEGLVADGFSLHVWRPAASDAGTKLPLLLYAPGWAGVATDSARLVADLASRGYVIIGFDDVRWDPGVDAEETAYRMAAVDLSSEEAVQRTKRAGYVRARLETTKASRILDAISRRVQGGEPWWASVDIDQVGMLGFSFGGAVAAEVLLHDPRFKAGANLDGGFFGDATTRGVPQRPYLLLSSREAFPTDSDLSSNHIWRRLESEWWRLDAETHAKAFGRPGFHWFVANEARHEDLSDRTFSPPWREAFRRSWTERLTERASLSRVLTAFFDTYVRGRAAPLMQGADAPPGTQRVERLPWAE